MIKFMGYVIFIESFFSIVGGSLQNPSLKMILSVANFSLVISDNVAGFQFDRGPPSKFFPIKPFMQIIYGGLTTLLFNAYIVYDIDNLIKQYT
jgi:FtsH-binding integral membrane protein